MDHQKFWLQLELRDLGLKATIAVNSAISNPTQSEPDRFQAEQLQANQQCMVDGNNTRDLQGNG